MKTAIARASFIIQRMNNRPKLSKKSHITDNKLTSPVLSLQGNLRPRPCCIGLAIARSIGLSLSFRFYDLTPRQQVEYDMVMMVMMMEMVMKIAIIKSPLTFHCPVFSVWVLLTRITFGRVLTRDRRGNQPAAHKRFNITHLRTISFDVIFAGFAIEVTTHA